MNPKFEVKFLEQAVEYIDSLEEKVRRKVFYNLDKARYVQDPKLFKKLDNEIWEFRTNYSGQEHRLLAFWVKNKGKTSLVVATHGFVKKVSKVPKLEIKRAHFLRDQYLDLL